MTGESREEFEHDRFGQAGPAEGVAAPLEPSQERLNFVANLEHDWMAQQNILDFRNWMIEKLWLAAAVSKNLQEELDLVKRVLLQHLNDEDFEYSLVGLYTKLTENDDAGKSPR